MILLQESGIVNTAIVNHPVGMATFGDLVRRAMQARGNMEGQELAELIRKSPSYVSKIINNNLKETPTPETLADLERVLGIPQPVMLAAWGYRVDMPTSDPFPYDSEKASLVAIVGKIEEPEARVLRKTAQAMIEEREARNVSRQERLELAST